MSERDPSKKSPWFLNFFGFILWGVSALAWLAHHTDWLPIIGNLLGMGGIFAWIAFLFGMISDPRKLQLQSCLDAWFDNGTTFKLLILLALVSVLSASFYGSIKFESNDASKTYYLDLAGEEVTLKAGAEARELVRTGWRTRSLTLKAPGLPKRLFKVKPFRHTEIKIPQDLYRPLVLVWPDHQVTQFAMKHRPKLEVFLERAGKREKIVSIDHYEGNPLWLGCADDVPVPAKMLELRKLELRLTDIERRNIELTFIRWARSQSRAEDYRPQDNDQLHVMVYAGDSKPWNEPIPLPIDLINKQRNTTQFEDFIEVLPLIKRKPKEATP